MANGAWGSGSFDYDTLGNLTYKTVGGVGSSYSYNSTTNRLSTVSSGYSFSYDDRGNVINNGIRAFSFNRANQLISSGAVTYAYDGYNRRIKQQTAAGVSYSLYNSAGQLMMRQNPAALRSFALYLGNNLIAERDIGSSNTIRYQHTDVLGSVIAESNTAGTLTGSSVYQPFGERIGGQKTGLGFTGHLEDTDIGLTYMQARYYDPVIGRFYSNDPVGTSGVTNFNRYAYANNNPYKYVDPNGEFAVPWHGGITFFAAWSSGHSFRESLSIAYRAMQADWESGSQGVDENSVARHAMSYNGQNPIAAANNHKALIANALSSGDLGLAAHAIQDQFAGGHSGFAVWLGGFFDNGIANGLSHLWHDLFPSGSDISSAYNATKTAISGKENKPRKSSGRSSQNPVLQQIDRDWECGVSCRGIGPNRPEGTNHYDY